MTPRGTVMVLALVAACQAWGQAPKKPVEHAATGQNVVARWSSCGNPAEDADPDYPRLERSARLAGKLVVTAKDVSYCLGSEVADPSYAIEGSRLRVRWRWRITGDISRCTCDHTIRFELMGVPAGGKYQVLLERVQ